MNAESDLPTHRLRVLDADCLPIQTGSVHCVLGRLSVLGLTKLDVRKVALLVCEDAVERTEPAYRGAIKTGHQTKATLWCRVRKAKDDYGPIVLGTSRRARA